jgi:hypothetical protein
LRSRGPVISRISSSTHRTTRPRSVCLPEWW